MSASIGSSYSFLRRPEKYAAKNLAISSIAAQAIMTAVVLQPAFQIHCSAGSANMTAAMPAKNDMMMMPRGSGLSRSSRSQNHSHKSAGSTPPRSEKNTVEE